MAQCFDINFLGQAGLAIDAYGLKIYVDPYLSNSVQELDSCDLVREVPIPIKADEVSDADYVLITHDHIDHCDPYTLPVIAIASPQAVFIGPAPVVKKLQEMGVSPSRTRMAFEVWEQFNSEVAIKAVPAAHPTPMRDAHGKLQSVGYLIDISNKKLYVSGDTFVHQEILDAVKSSGPIDIAFLPVNEHNFFLERRRILGNMSVREAFQFAEELSVNTLVPIHWDMFRVNSVSIEEMQVVYKNMSPNFTLMPLKAGARLFLGKISIIVRTLNEARYLEELLVGCKAQKLKGLEIEVVLVDSGSTDGTLEIARCHGCRVTEIKREEFSFGKSLNVGCSVATGDILVFISGHCIPTHEDWLQKLCQPIINGDAQYTYGRQFGGASSYFSEKQVFAKYYPNESRIPQEGFFCNNANAALQKSTWESLRFDEELTGLEDMHLAKRLCGLGGKVAYVADAAVYHYHEERWGQVRRRYERESIALQAIMPQVHIKLLDLCRYVLISILHDLKAAYQSKEAYSFAEIVMYRWNQFFGSWKGNHEHRRLSHKQKERYFFPSN